MNRRLLASEYKFVAKDKKVTFSSLLSGISISNIIVVYNATDNLLIYEVNSVIHTGNLVGLDLFFSYDTSGMSNSDDIEIYVNEAVQIAPPQPLPEDPVNYQVDVTGSIVELGPTSLAALENIEVSFSPGQGGLTDAQLRATPVPISGTVSTGGLTDAQIRATSLPVSGPLTDAQLRATPIDISGSLSIPVGASTEAKQDTIITNLDSIDSNLDTVASAISGTEMQVDIVNVPTMELGPTSLAALENISITVPGTVDLGTVTLTALETITVEDGGGSLTVDATNLDIRDLTFAADKVDVSGSSNVAVTGTFFQATQPVSAVSLPLPTGSSTESKQDTIITHVDGIETVLGTIDADTSNIALDTAAIKTAVEILDNAIAGNEMQVDIVSIPTVTISDGGGSITVDGTVAVTGAGDASAANQTTIIGHVDGIEGLLTTIDADTGNISTKIDTIAGAVAGNEMQVDVISMPTTTIQDGGGSITVDGPLTDAQLRATPVPISGSLTTTVDRSTLSAFGDPISVGNHPVIQLDFIYGINNQTGLATATNSAIVDTSNGRLRTQSGTNAAGSGIFQSLRPARYRQGSGVTARFTYVWENTAANNIHYAGAGNNEDGYFFGYNNAQVFGILHKNNTVDTFIPQTNWLNDRCDGTGASLFNWNKTVGNVIMIRYPFLGYGPITFWVLHPTGDWILCHTIEYPNTSAAIQISNPGLSFYVQNVNTGSTTNVVGYAGSVAFFINGEREYLGPLGSAKNNKNISANTPTSLLTIRNATTYNTKTNRSIIRINSISFSVGNVANNAFGYLTATKNPTLGGSPSFTPYDGSTADNGVTITTGNSCASIDIAGTTVTNGISQWNTNGPLNSTSFLDVSSFNLFIGPGETMAFTGDVTANGSLSVAVNWTLDI